MKTFLKIFLILIVLLVVGVGVFWLTFDLNSYRGWIENKMSQALGRQVKVGSLDMKLSLIPTIKAQNIQVENMMATFGDKPFVEVDNAEVTLSLVPLFSKQLEIQNVSIDTLNLNLVSKNGRQNWDKEETVGQGNQLDVRLDSLSISKLNVSYQSNDVIRSYKGTNLSLKQMKVFSLDAEINSIPFIVSGTVDSLWDFFMQKPDYLFNLEIEGVGVIAKFSGSIGNTKNFKDLLLNVDISGDSLKNTLAALNMSGKLYPAQPFAVSAVMQGDTSELGVSKMEFSLGSNKMKGSFLGSLSGLKKEPTVMLAGGFVLSDMALSHFWGVNPFSADLDFSFNKNGLILNNFSLRANRSDAQISGKVQRLSDKVKANVRIASEYFNTQDFFFSEEMFYIPELNPYAQEENRMLIADKPINLDFLKDLEAVVTVQMPHLKVSDDLQGYLGINSSLVVEGGVLSVNPLNITILGSKAIGDLSVSSVDNIYRIKLAGEGFQLNGVHSIAKVLKNAKADVSLDLMGQGTSVKSVLSTLNGQVLIDMSEGVIVNNWFNDLAEELNDKKRLSVSYSTSDRESKIICAALKADVKDGQITADDVVAIETSTINFAAGGNVNLVDETVNLTMSPSLNVFDSKLGDIFKTLGRFIKISGTFTDLKPTLTMDSAIQGISQLLNNKPVSQYQMCQQVLGRKTKSQQIKEAKQMQVLPLTRVVQEEPQAVQDASFKTQLMNSLKEALQ